jgi:hypothetical protein
MHGTRPGTEDGEDVPAPIDDHVDSAARRWIHAPSAALPTLPDSVHV